MAIEIVDFPSYSMVIFYSKLLNYQRVWDLEIDVDFFSAFYDIVYTFLEEANWQAPIDKSFLILKGSKI